MSRPRGTDLALDEEIRQVEARIEARRAELIATAQEAKERVRSIAARPTTLIAVAVLGFTAARLVRSSRRARESVASGTRLQWFARNALGGTVTRILPLFMGPLQGLALQWLARRFG